jgi:WD40 repeat protein
MERPLQVFCCYARNDQQYLYELKSHLMVLQHENLIEIKADIDISPGIEWEPEIGRYLEEADIILLLISANFIASDYCFNKEMQQAMERHKQGAARVVPLIIRSAAWENMPFGKLQALPKNAKPVTSWQNTDDAWTDIVRGIREIINALLMRGIVLPVRSPSKTPRRAVLIGLGLVATVGVTYGSITFLTRPQETRGSSPLYTYRGHLKPVESVAWSPNSQRIASGGDDSTAKVWNAANGSNVFTYYRNAQWVFAVAWSPNGQRIASSSGDGIVKVWNAVDGSNTFIYRGHPEKVYRVAWSPNGQRIASASADGTVQVWNAADGGNVFTYRGHAADVSAVAWSPDGTRIASASNDRSVQVWNTADGTNVFIYYGHSDKMYAVAWSPNGQRIASASADGTVQVWNATDGSNVFTYYGHSDQVWTVAWSPNGQRIASGGQDMTVQVWEA